ncbi:hypothetical protein Tco_1439868 [Tanacetum coccineum]
MYLTHTKIINSTISDDQIDSNIIFNKPNENVNSGSVEKDTHLELYKERVRVSENINGDNNYLNEFLEADRKAKHFNQQAQSQFVRDRDIIQDLEKQRDKLDLAVNDYKRKNEELQKTHLILKRHMSKNEDRYHDTILDLEAKLKKNVDLILKLRNSLQGMFMLGPKPLSVLSNSEILLNVKDTEDTLDDASKNHNLWDIIVDGDLQEEAAPAGEQPGPPAPKTAKQLTAKKNQERVKSILLLAIPDEYLLKFHNVPDAKSLWAAIKSRFGGNDESKKMQRNVLKHQFENFTTSPNKSLDKAYDRNKPDIDQTDIDDLYNNLRVYEDEMKRSSSSTSNSQNLAFLSSENTSSTNEVSTASGNFRVNTAGGTSSTSQGSSTLGADKVVCFFFAQKTISPPLDNEDLQQIDQDDLEELDIRWQVAMMTVRLSATTVTGKGTLLRKQKAKKGIHIDKSAKDESEEEREAFMKGKVTNASSESEIGIDAIPTATKPHSIVDWKIIPQSELYKLVIKKYGANRLEEIYDRVLEGDLKTMFDPPLSDDAIWSLPLQ